MILLRSFLSGHIRIKRTLEYYDAGIGPRVPFGGGFGPTVSAIFATALGDYTTLSSVSSMPTGGAVSRAGNAMLYVVDGGVAKLTYAPNNFLLWSQDFQTTAEAGSSRPWVIGNGTSTLTTNAGAAPDNTNTASLMAFSASAYPARYQQINAVSGVTYIFSVWMKLVSGSGANARVEFYSPGGFIPGVATNTTIDGSWKRIAISATATGSGAIQVFIDPNYVASATGSVLIWGAQLEAVTYQTTPSTYVATTTSAYYGPRFDYDPVTLAAKGLLVEGARTNYARSSQDLTNSTYWSAVSATPTSSATLGPDGIGTLQLITQASSGGRVELSNSVFSSGALNTVSFYVAAGSSNFVGVMAVATSTAAGAIFNLASNGSVVSTAGAQVVSAKIQKVGSLFRVSVTFLAQATPGQVGIGVSDGSTYSFGVYPSASSGTIYGGFAQLEAGSFATSYLPVPASAASTTRAAETLTLTGYTNRLVEAFYIDEQTNAASSYNVNASSTSPLTIINTGTTTTYGWGWYTSLRAYTNAYAGDIASPSWLSFSRAGNAMYYDSTGALTWAPSNMLLNSATLSTQSVTTAAINYVLSFKGTGSVALSGAYSGSLAGTGASTRVSLAFTSTVASLTLTVTGTVTEAQLEPVTYQTSPRAYIPTTSAAVYGPRFDYDPVTLQPKGLLVEGARTNIAPSVGNYTRINCSFTGTTTTAPDGTSITPLTVTTTAVTNSYAVVTATANTMTYSIYAKKGSAATDANRFGVYNSTTGLDVLFFNLNYDTGAITYAVGSSGASAVNVGNGWWRISITPPSGITSGNTIVIYQGFSGGSETAGEYAYVWGAQLEAGSFATSYIPTTTASVTRAADVATWTSAAQSSYFNAAAGAFGAQIIRNSSGGNNGVFEVPVSVGFNDMIFGDTNTDYRYGSGINVDTLTGTAFTSARVMVGYTASNFTKSLVVNNGTVFTGTAGGAPTYTGAALNIGRAASGTQYLNGHLQSFAYYNQRLPDAILKQKSSVNAPY